jgi:imidazole glycerol phosphate synthase subunit HisF
MNSRLINKVKNQYGKQAIVASVPVKLVNGQLFFYNSPAKNFKILSNKIISYIKDNADEVLIIDTQNEGINNSFNFDILEAIDLPLNKLMITGGIGQKQISLAKDLGLISCLIDNRILHRENFMKREL